MNRLMSKIKGLLRPPPPPGDVTNGTVQHRAIQGGIALKHKPMIVAAAAVLLLHIAIAQTQYTIGMDWVYFFRPAINEIFNWRSPYNVTGFYNPPWALFPLIPLAILPARLGAAVISIVSLATYYYAARRFGASPIVILALLFSIPVASDLLYANINWMVMLGLFMPPQIGLFFVLAKPQIGAAIALYWLVENWRLGGFSRVAKVFAPVTVAFAVSFLIYGFWPARAFWMVNHEWNMSLWPGSLPIGLVLLVYSLRRRDMRFAIAAAPMFSPYLLVTGWMFPLIAMASLKYETIAFVIGIGLWVLLV